MRLPRRDDEGFTLVETVIAMLIMSIAVVTIVSALSVMVSFNAEHRAHAVVEVDVRSFSQAVQAQAQSSTKLTDGVGTLPTENVLKVEDASLIPDGTLITGSREVFVLLGTEVAEVLSVDTATKQVTVARASGGTIAAHNAGAAVSTFFRCPKPVNLQPRPSQYSKTPATSAVVQDVRYWASAGNGTGSFVDWSQCDAAFLAQPTCLVQVLPSCTPGFVRATLSVTLPGDSRLNANGVSTATAVMLRRGSL